MSAVFELVLDCTKPFDLVSFMGDDWLKEVERDERAYTLTQVDFSKCQFLIRLKEGEDYIQREEMLRRLKEEDSQFIRHGGNQFMALWEDYRKNADNSVLEHIRLTQGITCLVFFGLILQDPSGGLNVLCLRWDDGQWHRDYVWFASGWHDRSRSSVSSAS